MKKSQRDWVVEQLRANGGITRNQCLGNYISRLSAIIQDLEVDGWKFETSRREGDYVYTVVGRPTRTIYEYDLIDGVRMPRKVVVPA